MDDKEDSNSWGRSNSPMKLRKFQSAEFEKECAKFKQRQKDNKEPYSKRPPE